MMKANKYHINLSLQSITTKIKINYIRELKKKKSTRNNNYNNNIININKYHYWWRLSPNEQRILNDPDYIVNKQLQWMMKHSDSAEADHYIRPDYDVALASITLNQRISDSTESTDYKRRTKRCCSDSFAGMIIRLSTVLVMMVLMMEHSWPYFPTVHGE